MARTAAKGLIWVTELLVRERKKPLKTAAKKTDTRVEKVRFERADIT
jgi:hypothetical protein